VINVLDPFEASPGDDDDDDSADDDDDDSDGSGPVVVEAPEGPQCGCSQGAAPKEGSDLAFLSLALVVLLGRRKRDRPRL
jgi:MYXO-CTERM domain-containing protein